MKKPQFRIKIILDCDGKEIKSLSLPKATYSRKEAAIFLTKCEDFMLFKEDYIEANYNDKNY